MNGQFVISLDLEKNWGIFDSLSKDSFEKNIENVDRVIDRLLALAKKYDIRLTFSVVGFLFNKNKEQFIENTPLKLPTYINKNRNPYPIIDHIGNNEKEDNLHYAHNALIKIEKEGIHEIGTHTYCHYYCLEEGQTPNQFEEDLKMARKVGKDFGIEVKSIVFPRNQLNKEHLEICKRNGIIAYRGNENHAIYKPSPEKEKKNKLYRALRLLDTYFNITGNHTYHINSLKNTKIINIPSSRFFRPYKKSVSFLEALKVRRVKKAMIKAANKKELFHIWFHPHNFGTYMDENFKNLEEIFKTFSYLKTNYKFESTTMTELAKKLITY